MTVCIIIKEHAYVRTQDSILTYFNFMYILH